MEVKGEENIIKYLESVCLKIKSKRAHNQIKEELYAHIEEKKKDYIKCGDSEKIAEEKALRDMGSSDILGEELNKVHKEKFNYRILITVAFLIITGIITMYSLRGNAYNYLGNEYFFINKMIIYTTLGIGAFLLISFFDYRKIKNKSAHLYILSIALFMVLLLFNSPINDIKGWISIGPVTVNIRDLAVNIFLISLVGIFKDIKWDTKKGMIYGLILSFIPLGFLMILKYSLGVAIIYTVTLIFLLYISTKNRKLTFGLMFMFIIALILIYSRNNYDNYLHNTIKELLESSVFIGQGTGIDLDIFSNSISDCIIASLIYSFGWVFGVLVLCLVLFLIIYMFKVSGKICDIYGKRLIIVISSIFACQYVLGFLYNFGILNFYSVSIPFISYGGSNIIISFLGIGIIMNIYKGKSLRGEY
ncbi:MAG: FtsW/RodA/SpoVE family cell cycle protein [Clostridium sp.]|uniref:FtsW/RodA/SpoVE family cell cycle protein n=1 Tax=Clostridium paraputrificum TaxID=29363 RepID=UPI000DD0EB5A|nr:FtsW/RodA/SpoVE family cell cycle protein [Clostridium paraputrificum]MDU6810004.1 FtsW/RodA/SpoVE family cell cycle protein [Clostridium sp.]